MLVDTCFQIFIKKDDLLYVWLFYMQLYVLIFCFSIQGHKNMSSNKESNITNEVNKGDVGRILVKITSFES